MTHPDRATRRAGVASGDVSGSHDIRSPEKRCFTYCGDDKCDCEARNGTPFAPPEAAPAQPVDGLLTLKLFVWVDPYPVSYGSTLVFAVARTVEEARGKAASGGSYSYGRFEQTIPGVTLGEPGRVVDVPCAEWHRWQE